MIGTKAWASRRHCDVYGNSSFTGEMAPIKPTFLLVEGKLHPIEISNTISNVFKLKIENVSCYGRKYCAIFTLPMTSLHKYHEPHARVSWCHNPNPHSIRSNVRGEPVFSVMAANWFCEKSGWIGKVEVVKPVLLKEKRISTGNHFEEEDFYRYELWNRWISSGLIHLGLNIICF
jgi:hypothetical protein